MKHISHRIHFLFEIWGHNSTKSRNIVAKNLRIERNRFTRIWGGADLYHHEVVAIKNYFVGASYNWLLEGKEADMYQKNMELLTTHIINELTEQEAHALADELRKQEYE
ncbi:MAG: hypothetical protein RPT11_02855 [Bermanella sp.]